MSRINTNIASMNAITKLLGNNADLSTRLKRLSSGLRINVAKDDPAGLIGSENLRSEMAGLSAGIDNSLRASSVIATAEGALNEISALLIDIKGLLVETANKGGLSTEEIDANQLQVDSAINSIQRIANATEFEGMKLLNGAKDYTTSTLPASISDLEVSAAKLIDGAAMTVAIAVTTSANTGVAFLSGATLSTSDMTIRLATNRGSTDLTFAAATTQANVQLAINNVKEITGVSAATSAGAIALRSVDFGADAYVSVTVLSGQDDGTNDTFVLNTDNASNNASVTDTGVDIVGTINGTSATGKGKKLTVRTSILDAAVTLTNSAAMATTSATFNVTGGGADFAIGSRVDAIGMEAIGIKNVSPSSLGNGTDGYLNTLKSGQSQELAGDNLYTAQRIVDDSIKDISTLRGRLGAFQKNILETNINSLRVTLENVTASESAIRDADFAAETAALTRAQILVQANTSVLSLANSVPQSVLALLG
ncbi:MAG: flagellin [Planctomycetes bacterium]|nr:flagellin [Planctomycetota bacterium]